jgi:hypothetical protein
MNHFEARIQELIETLRPPIEQRSKIDIGYSFEKNTLEIFEIRPSWIDESVKTQTEVAKAKYVKSRKIWKIYWMRANQKWELYPYAPEVKDISEFFEIVKEDEFACFFG